MRNATWTRSSSQGGGDAMPAGAAVEPCINVLEHLGLVHHLYQRLIATNHAVKQLGEVDAVGAGLVALCYAARGFKPEKGFKFSSYACRAIIREILYEAERHQRAVGAPLSKDPPDIATTSDEERERLAAVDERVQALLRKLPPRERHVIEAVFF